MDPYSSDRDVLLVDWRLERLAPETVAELAVEMGATPISTIKRLCKRHGLSVGDAGQLVDRFIDRPRSSAETYLQLQAKLTEQFPEWAEQQDIIEFEDETGWNRKLWALVEAGRHDEAARAIERFHPAHMRIQSLDLDEAVQLVETEIATWPVTMEIVKTDTRHHSFGWTLSCQSTTYLATGDINDMVVGHGPFLVDRITGALWTTGSALPQDECVANYLNTGNPSGNRHLR